MRARRPSARAGQPRLGWLLLLLAVCAFIAPAPASTPGGSTTPAAAPGDRAEWSAAFYHAGLGQPGTIAASGQRCSVTLTGSTPPTIALDRMLSQQIDGGRRISVYAGWPRNARGQITGVQNRSCDPATRRIIENKLGPTIVWAVAGCPQLCVKGIVMHYRVTISRGSDTLVVTQIDRPTPDAVAGSSACLAPAFVAGPTLGALPYAGAIDQPGCGISRAGDAFRDSAGRYGQLQAGDRVEIAFQHQAIIVCEHEVLGIVDWGYHLSATLGATADQITPRIGDGVTVELARRDDPDPARRAYFARALAAAQQVIELP